MENNTLTFEQMPYHTFEDIENLEYTFVCEDEEESLSRSKNVLLFWRQDDGKIFVTVGLFEKTLYLWDEENECKIENPEPHYSFMPVSSEDITNSCYPPFNLRKTEFAFMLLEGNSVYDTYIKMSWPVNIYSE